MEFGKEWGKALSKLLEPSYIWNQFLDEVNECDKCRRRTPEGRYWNFCKEHQKKKKEVDKRIEEIEGETEN